jgi:predicted DNA-binding protein
MMVKLMAIRLPIHLIEELKKLRKLHGIVISHFITEAVAEKIREIKEDEEDIATIESRKNEPSISEIEWKEHLKQKGIDV